MGIDSKAGIGQIKWHIGGGIDGNWNITGAGLGCCIKKFSFDTVLTEGDVEPATLLLSDTCLDLLHPPLIPTREPSH